MDLTVAVGARAVLRLMGAFAFTASMSGYAFEIDSSCFNLLPKLSEREIRKNFSHNLNLAQTAITWCGYRYPEIGPYLVSWRKSLGDLHIRCQHDSPGSWSASHMALPKFLYDPTIITLNLASKQGEPLLKSSLHSISDRPINTLAHEIFHSTGADNYTTEEHNGDVTRISPSYASSGCDSKDITTDRVNILTAICTGTPVVISAPSNALDGEIEVFNKIWNCGIQRGCIDLFLAEIPLSMGYFTVKSKPLSYAQAKSLCDRLNLRGACLALRQNKFNSQDMQKYLSIHPLLKEMRAHIGNVLSKKLPKEGSFISFELLNAVPGLNSGYENLRASICFKEDFLISEEGLKPRSGKLDNSHQASACSAATRKNVREWHAAAKELIFEPLTKLRDFAIGSNDDRAPVPHADLDKALSSIIAKNLFGEGLTDQYKKLLSKHYPGSQLRTCDDFTAGDLMTLPPYFLDLTKKAAMPAPESCRSDDDPH